MFYISFRHGFGLEGNRVPADVGIRHRNIGWPTQVNESHFRDKGLGYVSMFVKQHIANLADLFSTADIHQRKPAHLREGKPMYARWRLLRGVLNCGLSTRVLNTRLLNIWLLHGRRLKTGLALAR